MLTNTIRNAFFVRQTSGLTASRKMLAANQPSIGPSLQPAHHLLAYEHIPAGISPAARSDLNHKSELNQEIPRKQLPRLSISDFCPIDQSFLDAVLFTIEPSAIQN